MTERGIRDNNHTLLISGRPWLHNSQKPKPSLKNWGERAAPARRERELTHLHMFRYMRVSPRPPGSAKSRAVMCMMRGPRARSGELASFIFLFAALCAGWVFEESVRAHICTMVSSVCVCCQVCARLRHTRTARTTTTDPWPLSFLMCATVSPAFLPRSHPLPTHIHIITTGHAPRSAYCCDIPFHCIPLHSVPSFSFQPVVSDSRNLLLLILHVERRESCGALGMCAFVAEVL